MTHVLSNLAFNIAIWTCCTLPAYILFFSNFKITAKNLLLTCSNRLTHPALILAEHRDVLCNTQGLETPRRLYLLTRRRLSLFWSTLHGARVPSSYEILNVCIRLLDRTS
jgi:hypothetical protein